MQTLVGKTVTGEFHEVTTVSYDAKGRRQEVVMFTAQPSLRGIQLTQDDMEDVRTFMPLILTIDDLPQYNLSYAGQQHVDDHYWFPAYTRSDDTLQFRSGAVHIREIIKYTGYKRVDSR